MNRWQHEGMFLVPTFWEVNPIIVAELSPTTVCTVVEDLLKHVQAQSAFQS